MIVAAAVARPLLEAAAAIWHSTNVAVDNWNHAKAALAAEPTSALGSAQSLTVGVLPEWFGGIFFNKKTPELSARFPAGMHPVNVVTHLDKLSKRASIDLQSAYAWLCNTVHPSVGGTMLYSSPPRTGVLDTYQVIHFHSGGVTHEYDDGSTERADTEVVTAIFDAAVTAVGVIAMSLMTAAKSSTTSV